MVNTDVLEIAPSGDVVLICAPSPKADVPHRLRVSSTVLSLASSVFKALLGPKFREGNELAANGYVEVSLPDDAAEPMITLLKALHLNRDIMNHLPKPLDIVEAGILADKYDCCTALNHTAFYWTSNHDQGFEMQKMSMLLMASYYFRQAEQFQDICNDLVMRSRLPIVAPEEAKATGLEMLFVSLERARSHKLEGVREFLEDILAREARSGSYIAKTGCTDSERCFFEARRAQVFLREFRENFLWPSNQLKAQSVDDCIEKLKCCDMEDLDYIEPCCQSCSGHTFSDSTLIEAMFEDKAETIEGDHIDFCLNCVRKGNMSWEALERQCNHRTGCIQN